MGEAILTSAGRALILILAGDREVWQITSVSFAVSGCALLLAALAGVPLGYGLALSGRRVGRLGAWLVHTCAALPTVVVGLTLYFALSASGPLGWMELLYTRTAMVAGQFVLAVPVVAALTLVAVGRLAPEARETAFTLGLGPGTRMLALLREARASVASALLLAFGRIFTELGAAVILGGNIRGHTRTLTTVIALEHARGDDARAIALGLILLLVALLVNGVVHATAIGRTSG